MNRLTLADLPQQYQNQVVKQLYASNPGSHDQTPAPLVERGQPNAPLAAAQTEASDPRKCVVRVVSFRRRLLDEDNICEKYHIDALRYLGVLASDAPGHTQIITSQTKVKTKGEERTVIEITIPKSP